MGDILDYAVEIEPGIRTWAIEVSYTLCEILTLKGYHLTEGSCLESQVPDDHVDVVLMNPPFENLADIDHVRWAFDKLKPGGTLVAIMSESVFFRDQKKPVDFRDWLVELGANVEELPEGSFTGKDSFRQTGVRARIVSIEKPGILVRSVEPACLDEQIGIVEPDVLVPVSVQCPERCPTYSEDPGHVGQMMLF